MLRPWRIARRRPSAIRLTAQSAFKLRRRAHDLTDEGPVRIAGIILRNLAEADVEHRSVSPPGRRQQRLLSRELPSQAVKGGNDDAVGQSIVD